jgi:hypothetical protein
MNKGRTFRAWLPHAVVVSIMFMSVFPGGSKVYGQETQKKGDEIKKEMEERGSGPSQSNSNSNNGGGLDDLGIGAQRELVQEYITVYVSVLNPKNVADMFGRRMRSSTTPLLPPIQSRSGIRR